MFSTGSVARFYLNGHIAGSPLDISNSAAVQAHDFGQLRIGMLGGTDILLDEVAIWSTDWSTNGSNASPFSNGRGPLPARVDEWEQFD